MAYLLLELLWSPCDLIRRHDRRLIKILNVLIDVKVRDATLHDFAHIDGAKIGTICGLLVPRLTATLLACYCCAAS